MDNSTNKTPTSTKIAIPWANDPVPRPRLFERLDHLRHRPIVWVVGPKGSGKTTLASTYLSTQGRHPLWYQLDAGDADIATFFHYFRLAVQQAAPHCQLPPLTPEYLSGLTRFTRRYAEVIGALLVKPAVLVLDNYEQVPNDAPLHEVIRELATSLPSGISLLVLSRIEPPPAFARLRVYGQLVLVNGSELNLTPDEALAFSAAWKSRSGLRLTPEYVEQVRSETQGWIAGFTLLLGDTRKPSSGFHELSGTRQLVFDYFATELFGHFPSSVQQGLLRTALLPVMTLSNVEQLTGDREIAAVLADLQRRNCFVVQRGEIQPIYEYHALFREFLLNRARAAFEPAEWRRLLTLAGDLLAQGGHADDAAECYRGAEAWTALADLTVREAPGLLAACRHRTLDQWANSIPPTLREREPWLLFWQGMARSPFHPAEARGLFERAYSLFEERDDAAGLYSSWAGIMETFLNEWRDFRPVDRWIAEFKRLRVRHPEFPSPDVELRTAYAITIVSFRRPQEPLVRRWAERAIDLLDPVNHLELSILLGTFVIIYASWQGDWHKMRLIIDRLDAYTHFETLSPLSYILWRVAGRGAYHALTGDIEAYEQCAKEVLAMPERTGLHIWEFRLHAMRAHCRLAKGDITGAEAAMDAARDNGPNQGYNAGSLYHHLRSNAAGQRGDWPSAVEHASTAVTMAIAEGLPFVEAICRIDLARALFQVGETEEAQKHLNTARAIADEMGSLVRQNLCLVAEASAAFQTHWEQFGLARLAEALALSRLMGGPLWESSGPAHMVPLYSRALAAGIEVEHVKSLIRRHRFVPPNPATVPDNWPWPVRVYTLGRFEILCDDEPLRFSRKPQYKPLELIKIFCGFGGHAIHQDRIVDVLWPDATGDAAEQALATTLHRLRKLLRQEQAIRVEDHRLSLDSRYVWVDALVFDRIAQYQEADRGVLQSALRHYHGPFLDGESSPWVLTFRERLCSHFLKLSERLGSILERDGDWPAAIDCYLRLIEIKPTAESFYRRLMICYAALGQRVEALAVFQRCRQSLLIHLGVSPTPETQDLYQRLIEH